MFSMEKWKKIKEKKRLSSFGQHSIGKKFQNEGLMRFLHQSLSGQQIRRRAPSMSKVAYYFRRFHFRNERHLRVPQLLPTLLRNRCEGVDVADVLLLLLPVMITARPLGRRHGD